MLSCCVAVCRCVFVVMRGLVDGWCVACCVMWCSNPKPHRDVPTHFLGGGGLVVGGACACPTFPIVPFRSFLSFSGRVRGFREEGKVYWPLSWRRWPLPSSPPPVLLLPLLWFPLSHVLVLVSQEEVFFQYLNYFWVDRVFAFLVALVGGGDPDRGL